ncbi:MAG TPA: hypothetical protein VFS22_08585 [Flavisolibacter sp.]|nr:hypothetical protein [Flavisolibacter sp.]
MRFISKLFPFVITAILAGCTGRDQKDRSFAGSTVFSDYRIWSEEGRENVTCLFQFRMGGPDGPPVLLEAPSAIQLDGEKLAPDSTKLTGTFYETIKPVAEFKGKHAVIYTDAEEKQHKLEFEFRPFYLASELPAKVTRRSFSVKLAGFSDGTTPLHLILVDTAFATNDVNEMVEAVNGEIEIRPAMLDKLKAGPVVLEIFQESTTVVREEKARIWISYGLRREFELTE